MRRFIWSAWMALALAVPESAIALDLDKEVPGAPSCEKLADKNWNEAEKFVWRCSCAGEPANFNGPDWTDPPSNKSECREGMRIPGKSQCWQDKSREISSEFLETILYETPFRDAVTRFGVSIEGAHFTETVNLKHGEIVWPLQLLHSRFEGSLEMSRMKTDYLVNLSHSYFLGQIKLGESLFGHYLYIRHTTSEHLNLGAIHIEKHLDLDGSRVLDLDGNASEKDKGNLAIGLGFVGTNLHMQNVEADRAFLKWVKVGNLLTMRGTTIFDKLNLESAVIGGNLHMHRVKVGNADLNTIKVGGLLSLENALIFEVLNLESAVLGSQLLMNCMAAFGEIKVISATIKSNLDLSYALFHSLATTDSKAGIKKVRAIQETEYCKEYTLKKARRDYDSVMAATVKDKLKDHFHTAEELYKHYQDEDLYKQDGNVDTPTLPIPAINLEHTTVGTLISTPDSWPASLRLRGLIYSQKIATADAKSNADTRQWSAKNYTKWLENNQPFSLQPYEQLASVLRAAGRSYDADKVLYEGREQKRKEEKVCWKKWVLWVWGIVLGHGIGIHTLYAALYGLLPLSLFGWFLLWLVGERQKYKDEIGGPIGFWFSVDYMLPAIRLRDVHYENVHLTRPFLRGYFYYFLQSMGYALMFFIIAGLSGIIR